MKFFLLGQAFLHSVISYGQTAPLAQYVWSGCLTEHCVTTASQYFNSTIPVMPQTLPLSALPDGVYQQLSLTLKNYLIRFGVDISLRIPDSAHLHLFASEEFEKLRVRYSLSNGTVGVHSASSHLFVLVDSRNMANTLGTLQHEMIHVLSHRNFEIPEQIDTVDPTPLKEGFDDFANNREWRYFSEAFTEMINLKVILNEWSDHSKLGRFSNTYTGEVLGYPNQICLIDAVFEKIADSKKVSYETVFDLFQKDYFTGGNQSLKMIEEVFGIAGYELIKKLPMETLGVSSTADLLGLNGPYFHKQAALLESKSISSLPIALAPLKR